MLLGVSQYPKMSESRQLPAVDDSVVKLAELLCDKAVWGLPPENCVVLRNVEDPDTVVQAIREAASTATEALVFYYAGHGLFDAAMDDGLSLALSPSYEPGGTHTALRYGSVRREFLIQARAARRLVLLDCCWSGLAISGAMGSDDAVAATVAIEGTAVLTACAGTRKALSPPGEPYTAFTGALIDVLEDGIPEAGPTLTVQSLFGALQQRLAKRNRPLPQLASHGAGAAMPVSWNQGHRRPADATPPARSTDVPATTVRSAAATQARIRALTRAGAYDEALAERLTASRSVDEELLPEWIAYLRRTGRYREAAELE
ncbi:Caspase domain-containing protein [Nocardia amikacinitolerans]|uniref:Caspase domain-containing protein n=1 Tax=Nocardia amikacinitolerans TaxID=756689 RepID=A0A285L648_9NOCA|nr:caspase family protein [Nocardia amikacinitolerans]MCP2297006.1 Caspase domain-containing protein [Nocardia amikacinitolerans]SNY80420.1 Caspase domain-containing protein [Nocardia amikacinitolerans]